MNKDAKDTLLLLDRMANAIFKEMEILGEPGSKWAHERYLDLNDAVGMLHSAEHRLCEQHADFQEAYDELYP